MTRITEKQARKIIADLLGAGCDGVNVAGYDGGKHHDIVWSRKRGHSNKPMSLEESERITDLAIRVAAKALGHPVPRGVDPVGWVNP